MLFSPPGCHSRLPHIVPVSCMLFSSPTRCSYHPHIIFASWLLVCHALLPVHYSDFLTCCFLIQKAIPASCMMSSSPVVLTDPWSCMWYLLCTHVLPWVWSSLRYFFLCSIVSSHPLLTSHHLYGMLNTFKPPVTTQSTQNLELPVCLLGAMLLWLYY